jgi:hypothetical protein
MIFFLEGVPVLAILRIPKSVAYVLMAREAYRYYFKH